MSKAVFYRLLDVPPQDKGDSLASLIHAETIVEEVFQPEVDGFSKIPNTTFAYWSPQRLLNCYDDFTLLEAEKVVVRSGLGTTDNFRFLRLATEVPAQERNRRWVPHAKGGQYSPYYFDTHLVVEWENNGKQLKAYLRSKGDSPSRYVRSESLYYRPGLTWPLRTQRGLNVRAMPAGAIFGHKGPAVFHTADSVTDLLGLLGLLNSTCFRVFVELQMAFGSYEVGVVQRTPVPDDLSEVDTVLVLEAHDLTRAADTADETTHAFRSPGLTCQREGSLLDISLQLEVAAQQRAARLAIIQADLDETVFNLYGLNESDRTHIRREMGAAPQAVTRDDASDDEDEQPIAPEDLPVRVQNLLMWCIGVAFGRWDARFALDPTLLPALQGPFDPLPRVAPGGLVGSDGLPATQDNIAAEAWLRARHNVLDIPALDARSSADALPLPVAWNGILVDDPTHPADLVGRVEAVIQLLWQGRADAIIQEACAILGFKTLRDYFRHPGKGFFPFHIKRYSKSRRKAPIYWLLQSDKRNYAIWLYCHRLRPDAYYAAARNPYADAKVALEAQKLADLQQGLNTLDGATLKRRQRDIERQQNLVDEVTAFRNRLDAIAKLDLPPDLNDGILISMAPLHPLVPWKEVGKMWDALAQGDYAWSTMAQQMQRAGMTNNS